MWLSIASLVLLADGTPTPPAKVFQQPTCIAHRGASYLAPEHTIAAYKLALKYGAEYVEPDLQLTKDGVLICLHDATLDRTTDVAKVFPDRFTEVNGKKTYPVVNFTWAEVQKLDAGSWKGEKFHGERVPSLQQMIDAVRGKAGILPETKSPESYSKHGLNMEKALMEVLRANKLHEPGADPKTPVVIQSFSEKSLKALRNDHQCKLPMMLTFSTLDTSPERLKEIRSYADGIMPNKMLVFAKPELVKVAHAAGLSVAVWTIRQGQTGKFANPHDEMKHLIQELKVDAIFTDNPEQFPRK